MASLVQAPQKRLCVRLGIFCRSAAHEADQGQRLLCVRDQRPTNSRAEKPDEVPAVHSTT
jgi:hypothetical protein